LRLILFCLSNRQHLESFVEFQSIPKLIEELK
jgi:hypothetical protein